MDKVRCEVANEYDLRIPDGKKYFLERNFEHVKTLLTADKNYLHKVCFSHRVL